MKPKSVCGVLTIIFFLCSGLGLTYVYADDEGALGDSALQSGKLREAFTHYMAGYQAGVDAKNSDLADNLRLKIFSVVGKLHPLPAIPDEARRFSMRGKTAIQDAGNASDFADAAKEFGMALRLAPWWAEVYFNRAVAYEKAGQLPDAVQSLKWYLLAAPDAADADNVKDRIYALEFRLEKTQKEANVQQEAEEQRRKAGEEEKQRRSAQTEKVQNSLPGSWVTPPLDTYSNHYYYGITTNGTAITITLQNEDYGDRVVVAPAYQSSFKGTMSDYTISGTWENSIKEGAISQYPFSGTISPDGDTITLTSTALLRNADQSWSELPGRFVPVFVRR